LPKRSPEEETLRRLAESGAAGTQRDELARALARLAFGILVRRARSADEARTALPEAVRLLLASRRRWRQEQSSRVWALSVLRGLALPGPSEAAEGRAPASLDAIARADPASFASDPALVDALRAALGSLEPDPREALELVAIEGLSFGEAAQLLGQPPAVVEQRASVAFAALARAGEPASSGCAALREALLARALGRLSAEELSDLDQHARACEICAGLLRSSERAMALLRAYREATDLPVDGPAMEAVLGALAERDMERAARQERSRRAQAESSRPARRRLLLGAAGALALVAVAGVATRYAFFRTEPPRPNPVLELLGEVTDAARARDLACVLDIQLQEEWAREAVRERRVATLLLARWLARREGFADSLAFLRAVLSEHARTVRARRPGGTVFAAERGDPLRLAGELKQAGLHALAAKECARVADSAKDALLRRRARLHGAASLLLEGRLDEAAAALSELRGESVEAGGDFHGRLASLLQARLDRAREAREALKTHSRPKPDESDYRGGELGLRALDRACALEAFAGAEQPILVGLLSSAWAKLLAGETLSARVDLSNCFQRGQKRFTRSLAQLGLAEAAFLEGRYLSGLGHLRLAQEHAPDTEGASHYVSMVSLLQGLRELVDLGSAPSADSFLKTTEQVGAVEELLRSAYEPRVAPLAAKRDAVTRDWPKSDSPFHKVLGRTPGSVVGTDALLASFEQGPGELSPEQGSTLSSVEGLSGRGVRVESGGPVASVGLALDIPEIETWAILAARPSGPGRFELRAADSGGRLYRWRTFLLVGGEWNRLAVPLGAFEPEEPSSAEDSLLAQRIARISLSFEPQPGAPARFDLDELVVRHGQKTEERGADAPVSR